MKEWKPKHLSDKRARLSLV